MPRQPCVQRAAAPRRRACVATPDPTGAAPSAGLACVFLANREPTMETNDARIRPVNAAPLNRQGDYILYWMQAYRRLHHNHALDHAVALARSASRPLVVYEGLKLGYPWASRRLHRFVLEGMRDNAAEAAERQINYWPFVETP